MQDNKDNLSSEMKKPKSILSLRKMCKYLKKFFVPWVVVSAVAGAVIGGINSYDALLNRKISATVNFSFSGVETGHDPLGNKFDVNEIKSESAVQAAVKELGFEDVDVKQICSSISISGNVPNDVIERITKYNATYTGENVETIQNIQDTTYYPTQYTITMDSHKIDLDFTDCVKLLNNITERYKQSFSFKYGYKKSLANAVTAFDYTEYDYTEAVDVFDSSLESLYNYIINLAEMDTVRFRSAETGYTFSDLAESIKTIRNENLDMISAYITLYNMTKDKDILVVNYQYKVEEYERRKKIGEEKLAALNETLGVYEKNAIMIFSQATSGADATLNQSSDTYDTLIEQVVITEKNISECQQQIDKYNKRINGLQQNNKKGSKEKLEEDMAALNEKILNLLDTVEKTVCEYYEEEVYVNAYEVLSLASDSTFGTIVDTVKDSKDTILSIEMIILSIYLIISAAAVNEKAEAFVSDNFSKLRNKISKSSKSSKAKKSKSKGGRK